MIWTSGDDLATWPVRDERARVWWINAIRCWFECISKFNNLARVCVCMLSFHSTSIWIDLSIAHFCAIPVNEDELNENWVLKSNPFMFSTYKHTAHRERDAILSEQFHYEANLSSIRWHLFLALSYTIQYICLRFVKILVTAFIELYSLNTQCVVEASFVFSTNFEFDLHLPLLILC